MPRTNIQVLLLEEARDFLNETAAAARRKIYYNIRRVLNGERDADLFKKLGNTEIWEFRTIYNGLAYRLFAFWDKETGALVVATHGLVKKTQKTPSREIAKAERIRQEYFDDKKKGD